MAAIHLGHDQAAATCPGVPAFNPYHTPRVVWHACAFEAFGVCAAGATFWKAGYIAVSTAEPWRTLALCSWESRNWYWYEGDCRSQLR